MDDKELLHYGVPGMKWGVRKQRDELTKARRASKEDRDEDEEHEDYKRTLERKSLKSMSTNEINAITNRINAEENYRKATMSNAEKVKEWARGMLIDVGKNSARRFVDHYANAGVDKVTGFMDEKTPIGKLFGLQESAEQNRKAADVKLDTTRKSWDKVFGKKDDEPEAKKDDNKKTETPKAEEKKSENEKTETPKAEEKKTETPKVEQPKSNNNSQQTKKLTNFYSKRYIEWLKKKNKG